MKENQNTWLVGSVPLPNRCSLYPRIRIMLLGVTGPVLAPRIRAAQDVESGREKESQAPPMEMEVISQCGSGVLEDYKPSRTNLAEIKLEGQLDVVEYSRITVPESVHMGDPAGGCMEMVKARNSARGHLMA